MQWFALILLLTALAACQPAALTPALPTLAVLPSLTPTTGPSDTPTLSPTPPPTDTPTLTLTPTDTATPTDTPPPTRTPRPTATPRATVEPTLAALGTATEAALRAPRFSTLTPAPGAPTVTGTPLVAAAVVINQRQFQEQVNERVKAISSIQSALVDFVPGGIDVQLTALGGEAYITGKVSLAVQLTGDFATITIRDIQVNAPEPPEAYVQVVNVDFFPMMFNVLDSIVKERLGPQQKLKSIAVTDNTIELTLLVPGR
jgi:hypothetical protein